jgi:hypothetical protein
LATQDYANTAKRFARRQVPTNSKLETPNQKPEKVPAARKQAHSRALAEVRRPTLFPNRRNKKQGPTSRQLPKQLRLAPEVFFQLQSETTLRRARLTRKKEFDAFPG